jgi:uncharacterized membrane protein HdeD (DUF308 family)
MLRGVLIAVFGLFALAQPRVGLAALVLAFAVWAIADAVAAAVAMVAHDRTPGGRAWLLVEAVIGLAAGIFALVRPAPTAVVLLFIVALRAICVGAVEIVDSIRLHRSVDSPWLTGLAGVVSLAFGMLLFARPGVGLVTLGWLIGVYALIEGALQLATGASLIAAGSERGPFTPPTRLPAT